MFLDADNIPRVSNDTRERGPSPAILDEADEGLARAGREREGRCQAPGADI